jgi:hypothetical protein
VLPALAALVSAQLESFSFGPIQTEEPATSLDNIEPTATPTQTGPINTASACADISDLVEESDAQYPIVAAEVSI